jgi:hypothetical protein
MAPSSHCQTLGPTLSVRSKSLMRAAKIQGDSKLIAMRPHQTDSNPSQPCSFFAFAPASLGKTFKTRPGLEAGHTSAPSGSFDC